MNINVKTIPGGRILVFEKQEIPPNGADNFILPVSLLITFWLVWQTHDWVYLALQEKYPPQNTIPIDMFVRYVWLHTFGYAIAFWFYFFGVTGLVRIICQILFRKPSMPNAKQIITTVKVNPNFVPDVQRQYPHFRMFPLATDTGRYCCLYFFVSPQHYLLLEAKARRHEIIRRLELLIEHAPFTVFETVQR